MITAGLHKELYTASGESTLNVDLTLQKGAVTSLFGASGVGKTMMLRMLAGLEIPDGGVIKYEDETWFDAEQKCNLAIARRRVGFVFQDYGLFPNMSIEENLRFAVPDKDVALIQYYLEVFGLASLKNRRAMELSGGQKQRTAIARALVFQPGVLLLDEPFTAQDKMMRDVVGQEILKFTEEHNTVTVLVTHEMGAIFQMATYIYSIRDGLVAAEGSVEDVFLEGSTQRRNGVQGIVADIVEREGREALLILINDQVLEIWKDDVDGHFERGDEVYLALNPGNAGVQLQKI